MLHTGMEKIDQALTASIENLSVETETNKSVGDASLFHSTAAVSILYSLSRDLQNITLKMAMPKE